MNHEILNTSRIIRLPEVIGRVGFGKTKIYALIKVGKFPQGFKLAGHSRGWLESEITDFIARTSQATQDF